MDKGFCFHAEFASFTKDVSIFVNVLLECPIQVTLQSYKLTIKLPKYTLVQLKVSANSVDENKLFSRLQSASLNARLANFYLVRETFTSDCGRHALAFKLNCSSFSVTTSTWGWISLLIFSMALSGTKNWSSLLIAHFLTWG